MAVAQKDQAQPHAPRKFTNDELLVQVTKWIAEGFQIFCVQESCGFGFVLHRRLVAAGAQSFLITPIALNGARKTDKLDARALGIMFGCVLNPNGVAALRERMRRNPVGVGFRPRLFPRVASRTRQPVG